MADSMLATFTTFGGLLRHLRMRAHLTQRDLGIAVGYSEGQINKLERNTRSPDPDAVKARFLEALDIALDSEAAAKLIALAATPDPLQSAVEDATLPTSERTVRNNLPFSRTSFIGRVEALEELCRLLPTTRLLTLTGTGGTGKTRLALELAERMLASYADGVWLIELAPLADPASIASTVLTALSVPDEHGKSQTEALIARLSNKHTLIILDNCEHLLDGCARLSDEIMRMCQYVQILATSREALGIAGELTWRVPSLSTPSATLKMSLDNLQRFEAVQLFLQRARFAMPGFTLDAENADAVQQICAQLDGIPLAIELAAARVKTLAPEGIAQRLNDRFRLLTGGSRAALPRQQTLRALIDWSYRMLTDSERTLLQRLSIFAGSCTLDAAEHVCSCNTIEQGEILDLLGKLVEKSLVMLDDTGAETRYILQETIRQYAAEKLIDAEESTVVRDRHLNYFLSLGEAYMPQLEGKVPTNQVKLLNTLGPDLDNILRALDWAIESDKIEDGYNLGQRYFVLFLVRGDFSELVARHYAMASRKTARLDSSLLLRIYSCIGDLHARLGETDKMRDIAEKLAEIGNEAQDWLSLAHADALRALCAVFEQDAHAARRYVASEMKLITEHNLLNEADLDEQLHIRMATILHLEGSYAEASEHFSRVFARYAGSGHIMHESALARSYGYYLVDAGDLAQASTMFRKSLVENSALSDMQAVAACLGAFAIHAERAGDAIRSARLFGASEALRERIRGRLDYSDIAKIQSGVNRLRQRRHEQTQIDQAWAEGRVMALDGAIAYALEAA